MLSRGERGGSNAATNCDNGNVVRQPAEQGAADSIAAGGGKPLCHPFVSDLEALFVLLCHKGIKSKGVGGEVAAIIAKTQQQIRDAFVIVRERMDALVKRSKRLESVAMSMYVHAWDSEGGWRLLWRFSLRAGAPRWKWNHPEVQAELLRQPADVQDQLRQIAAEAIVLGETAAVLRARYQRALSFFTNLQQTQQQENQS